MNNLKNLLYIVVPLCAFVYGIFAPLLTPQHVNEEIAAAFGRHPFFFGIAAACGVVLSAVTTYIMAHVAARQPTVVNLLLVKLFVFSLPAHAVGAFVSMLLGFLDVLQTKHPGILGAFAIMYLCAGISGIIAVNSIPQYRRLEKSTKGKT